jgi:hypothetical protein
MANGGANISRGMGRGAAQVYDTSGPVNMYAKLMQQQQLKRAAEQKALTDELGKVTPEGLRQPDVKGFIDQYGRWRDKAIEADAERNPTRKAILKQEAEREKLTTLMYKDDSKNELINERKRQEFLMNPENRNRYSKEIIAKIINSKNLSKDDIEYVRDMNKFEIKPDLTKIRKLLDDTDANLMKYTKPTLVQEQGERLGVKGLYESNVATLSPAEQATAYSVLFDTDEGEFKAFLRSLNPEFKDLSEKELKEAAIPILVQERPKSTYSDKKFISPDDYKEKARFREQLIRSRPDKDGVSISDIKVGPKTFTGTKLALFDKNTGKPIMDASGKNQLFTGKGVSAEFPVYSTVNPTAFKIPQNSSLYDIKRGVNKPIPKGISAALTGIGYAIVQGGGNELRATITTDEGDELMVKLADLPPDVRNDKFYKTTLQAVEDEYKRLQQSKPTTKPAKELIGETVRIQLPTGEIGEVPKDKSAAFLKKYPKAKIIK